jgi:hypothetical protein
MENRSLVGPMLDKLRQIRSAYRQVMAPSLPMCSQRESCSKQNFRLSRSYLSNTGRWWFTWPFPPTKQEMLVRNLDDLDNQFNAKRSISLCQFVMGPNAWRMSCKSHQMMEGTYRSKLDMDMGYARYIAPGLKSSHSRCW